MPLKLYRPVLEPDRMQSVFLKQILSMTVN